MNQEELKKLMVDAALKYVLDKLKLLGVEIGNCKACGEQIFWIKTKNGKMMPVCLDLTSHFSNCPKADEFRKRVVFKPNYKSKCCGAGVKVVSEKGDINYTCEKCGMACEIKEEDNKANA